MPSPISGIGNLAAPDIIRSQPAGSRPGEFQSVLDGAIRRVEQFQRDASQSVERFLAGEGEELHTTALAAQRAELAFELFLQTRNKVVQAYQEIMRMQM